MKKILIVLILAFSSSFFSVCVAQTWDSLDAGIRGRIYFPPSVRTITAYNSNIYAGGLFDSAGALIANYLAQRNGTSWDSVSNLRLTAIAIPEFLCETVYNGKLYLGGVFEFDNPQSHEGDNIISWDGTSWDTVGPGLPTGINALQVYNGSLYAGGGYSNYRNFMGIAQWNGIKWDTVKSGTYGTIYTLVVYNGELYAGGRFDTIGHIPVKNIAKWDGTNWSAVGVGFNSAVYTLTVYNGSLYAGGAFDSSGSQKVNGIASWNGSVWNVVGTGIDTSVYALTSYGSVLVAGGIFDSAGGVSAKNIAQWNGTSWTALGNGIPHSGSSVNSLYSDNGVLYVGGEFDTAGGIPANNIAVWRSPLGINEITANKGDISVFPNPNNGEFNISLQSVGVKSQIEVYNILGEMVYYELTGSNSQLSINLSSQPNGVYLYRIISENGNLVGEGKVVIQK